MATANTKFSRAGRRTKEGRYFTDTWQVQLAAGEETYNAYQVEVAAISAGLPSWGTAYPSYAYSYVRGYSLQRNEMVKELWEIQVEYEPYPKGIPVESPLDEWPDISVGFEDYVLIVEKDTSGNLILNPAGDRYDPAPEETYSNVAVTITRNVASFSMLTAREYKNSVNSADVSLLGITLTAGDGMLTDWSAKPSTINGIQHFSETLKILITDRDGRWITQLLALGLREKTADGVLARARDGLGEEVTDPVKLQSSGLAYSPTDQTDPSKYYYQSFTTKKQKAWSSLSLPTTYFKP